MKEVFFADDAPPGPGPFSHAVRGGHTVSLAGQGRFDPDTRAQPEGFEEQARKTSAIEVDAVPYVGG